MIYSRERLALGNQDHLLELIGSEYGVQNRFVEEKCEAALLDWVEAKRLFTTYGSDVVALWMLTDFASKASFALNKWDAILKQIAESPTHFISSDEEVNFEDCMILLYKEIKAVKKEIPRFKFALGECSEAEKHDAWRKYESLRESN